MNGARAQAMPSEITVATDNVPDGALEDNPDGSVNVYNEAGEKVGTVTAEEAKEAEQNVTTVVIEEDSGK